MILLRIKRKLSEAMPSEFDYKNKKFKHCRTINDVNIPSEYKGMPIQNVPTAKNNTTDSYLDLDIDISNLNFNDTYVYDYYMVEDDYGQYSSSSSGSPSEIDYPEEEEEEDEASEDDDQVQVDFFKRSYHDSFIDADDKRLSNLSMNSDSSNVWTHESESVVLDFHSSDYDEMNDLLY